MGLLVLEEHAKMEYALYAPRLVLENNVEVMGVEEHALPDVLLDIIVIQVGSVKFLLFKRQAA